MLTSLHYHRTCIVVMLCLSAAAIAFLVLLRSLPPAAHACETHAHHVEGNSMAPEIPDRATVTVRQGIADCFVPLHHGDIIMFRSDSFKIPLIKAVRGLPGDKFDVKDGQIIINGDPATNSAGQPYQLSPPRAAMIELYAHDFHGIIPPDLFLVMGENPAGTTDSSRFGLVPLVDVIGKVVAIEPPAVQ